jgi:hypothetical protein
MDEEKKDVGSMDNNELKDAISETVKKVRTQALLLGSQAMCSTILQKIKAFEQKSGKLTLNDHRRLVADIKNFCEIGLSRKVNLDGTTSIRDEESGAEEDEQLTIQNY